jgi:lambda family phage portal protein
MAANSLDPFVVASQLAASATTGGPWWGNIRNWTGSKFPGGFGATNINVPDYWELRARSAQLFSENLYARGLLRRLITNEINIGLTIECEPNAELLDSLSDEEASAWAQDTESRLEVWANNPKLCDYEGRRAFAKLQEDARLEALIEGDIRVVVRMSRRFRVPQIQLIRGGRIHTPLAARISKQNKTIDGVEIDERGRHVGFWVNDSFGNATKIPAFGERSKRRLAWLVYGPDKRMDQVRGEPMLSLVLQSLRELDRYRDSEQRAAVVNSLLAMFIQKNQDKMGTRPMTAGAVRNTRFSGTGLDSEPREFLTAEQWPGMVFEELQQGEEPKSFDTKRPNVNYAVFEEAIIQAIAWASEVPPEILKLAFSNNYSASKAAINEFKAYISKMRRGFGDSFCQPIFVEWLLSETISGRISAPGLLEAWRDPMGFNVFGAWTRSQWGGPVKPSVELKKDIEAYREAIDARLITRDRASKDLFGVRFDTVLRRWEKEEQAVRDMNDRLGISNDPEPIVVPPDDNGDELTTEQEETILELVRGELGSANSA